jgi:hypothetical protein
MEVLTFIKCVQTLSAFNFFRVNFSAFLTDSNSATNFAFYASHCLLILVLVANFKAKRGRNG